MCAPDGVLVPIAVGILAALVSAHVRLHLGLPGHKAIFWITPVLLARLVGRSRVGCTAGYLSAACASMGAGGHLAGDGVGLPLIGLAGLVSDAVLRALEARRLSLRWMIPAVAGLGMTANLLACVKRWLLPRGILCHGLLGLMGPWSDVASYAAFGLLAGLMACVVAASIGRNKSPRPRGPVGVD